MEAVAPAALPSSFATTVGTLALPDRLAHAAELLEGASASARIGLDIGGTLCKVVYFEPLRDGDGVRADGGQQESEVADEVCECSREHGTRGEYFRLGRPDKCCGDAVSEEESSRRQARKIWVSSHDPVVLPGRGTLYFKCFETWRMEEFLSLTREHSLVTGGRVIGATGGGAKRFKDRFLEIAGLQLQKADELSSLVRGIDFLVRHAHHEGFEYPTGFYQGGLIQKPLQSPESSSDDGSGDEELRPPQSADSDPQRFEKHAGGNNRQAGMKVKGSNLRGPVLAKLESGGWLAGSEDLYPYLVVNIGSGVSILRVDSTEKFERVGGTSLGGSTFLGLALVLTGCDSFEEVMKLAMQGDSTEIDMLVGDIYGGDYSEMGLAATTVASSFGKLVHPGRRAKAVQSPEHLAKAALLMITNNIGSLAMLHARPASVRHIMFTGSFLHNNKLALRLLAVAMEFWSKGDMKAVFLRHEGHAGAMGALLSTLDHTDSVDELLLG